MPPGLLEEVRGFLAGLQRELPEIFFPKSAPARPPVRGSRRPEARALILERVEHWSVRMGIPYGDVRIKDQRSLWGSCSVKGNLNFNWRLTMAPPEILDYVVVHELAHRLEMNHSRRFWRHVERWCPEHRLRRRWLCREGRELLSRGARPS